MRPLRVLTAWFTGLLVAATAPLWRPTGDFPVIPWLDGLLGVPLAVDRTLGFGIVLFSFLAGCFEAFFPHEKPPPDSRMREQFRSFAAWSALSGLAISLLLDQQRLQPWAWQLLWLGLILNLATRETALRTSRWLFMGIYAWSAWSKLDAGFVETQGPWLWQGLRRAIGLGAEAWGPGPQGGMMLAFPVGELLTAGLLAIPRTRRWGVVATVVMHTGLLLALGPWGRDQQPGVLLWNLFFLIAVPLLFWRVSPDVGAAENDIGRGTRGDRFCWTAVVVLSILPVFETVGLCDHWPAWAVYSSRSEHVRIEVLWSDVGKLPPSLDEHVGPVEALSEWRPVSLDAWSRAERRCPIYPQARYRLALARTLAAQGAKFRITEQPPPDRWTGERTSRVIDDLASDCETRFSFSTLARRPQPPPRPSTWGDWWIATTAQMAVGFYGLTLLLAVRQGVGSRPSQLMALCWTAGCVALAAHILCAFHCLHDWSHAAALQHTAERTAEVTGWHWPGGLYINYLFLAFWAWDAVHVWREALAQQPVAAVRRRWFIQSLFAFMMFNATVIFGPWHWTLAGILFGVGLWVFARRGIRPVPEGGTTILTAQGDFPEIK